MMLQPSRSSNTHYRFVSPTKILQAIDEEIYKIMGLTSMSYNWAFQLYEKCSWNIDTIYKVFDGKVSYRELIQYKEGYQVIPTLELKECEVCLGEDNLLLNSCGHSFCRQCWKMMLETSVLVDKDLMPKCQGDNCESKMNFDLIKIILEENKKLKEAFDAQLVIQYSRENDSVKVCPNIKCNNTFLISDRRFKPMWCKCENAICTLCGDYYHFPIGCAEVRNWAKMVSDQENQWIQIVQFKICPACKNPIEKNEGCNHMTCRCKHEFCWICLKDWRAHGVCKGREDHDKMEEERKKMLENGQ